MWRLILNILGVFFFGFILSYLPFNPDGSFFNTMFTITGIFYSIGFSLVLGFDYSRIDNAALMFEIRANVKTVGRDFTVCFAFSTVVFLIANTLANSLRPCLLQYKFIKFSFCSLCASILLFAIVFLVYNFIQLQHLRYDLDDKIREELNKIKK